MPLSWLHWHDIWHSCPISWIIELNFHWSSGGKILRAAKHREGTTQNTSWNENLDTFVSHRQEICYTVLTCMWQITFLIICRNWVTQLLPNGLSLRSNSVMFLKQTLHCFIIQKKLGWQYKPRDMLITTCKYWENNGCWALKNNFELTNLRLFTKST